MKERKNRTSVTYSSPGIVTILQVVFIVLKLCKVIEWSWFWVLSPTWIMIIVAIFVISIIILLPIILKIILRKEKHK